MNIEDVMAEARLEFIIRAPYLAHAMLSLIPHPTNEVQTCAVTDQMVLLYNPDYFLKLAGMNDGIVKVASRLWHEVGHVMRDTFGRLTHIDKVRRNICCDLAINSSGLEGGWDFSPDGLLPSNRTPVLPDDLSAEEYNELLPEHEKSEEWGGKCGSGAGNPLEIEARLDATLGRSTEEVEVIQQQVAASIEDYASKHPGKIPGEWSEWARAVRKPSKISWRTYLRTLTRHAYGQMCGGGGMDVSYTHPALRSYTWSAGPMIPGDVQFDPITAHVLDTSGSMSLTQIGTALRETKAVLTSCGASQAWLLQVDAQEQVPAKMVKMADLDKLKICGRGGTDFRPAFVAAAKLRPKPNLVLYYTDGFGPAPEKAPLGMDVIWVLMGKETKEPCTWGRVVRVDLDE